MNANPSFLPRLGDLGRDELIATAQRVVERYGGPKRVDVHFKFTCKWCGTRCTLTDANILYAAGECAACGKETEIVAGGFSIEVKL